MAAESSHPHTGLRLDHRYQLTDALATGALCEVYRGEDLILRRPIAVKAVAAVHAEPYRAALHTTATLTHPAVVTLYDAIEQEDTLFLVQEYVPAYPLTVYLQRGVPGERAIDLAGQIARALAYAHKHDIIHGDLTPAAVLVDRQAVVRLNNFGLPSDAAYFQAVTRAVEQSAVPGEIQRPPETGVGTQTPFPDAATAEGDVWALGALLWQMLIGAPLGSSEEREALDYRPDVPQSMRALVAACIGGQGQARIADAEALALELEHLAHTLAQARPALSSVTPPALRIAREVAARDATWSVEATLGNKRSLLVDPPIDSRAHSAPTDPLTADFAATRSAGEYSYESLGAPRLRLPSRPLDDPGSPYAPSPYAGRDPARPAWAAAPARGGGPREYEATGTARRGNTTIYILMVVALGTILFAIFFFLGLHSPSLFP